MGSLTVAISSGLIAISGGLGACLPQGDAVYKTARMTVYAVFDTPLCAGDLEYHEAFISHTEAVLGVEMHRPVDVYLYRGRNFVFLDEGDDLPRCSDWASGCYRRSRHEIVTHESIWPHELVHAVTASDGRPGRYFNEGIALAITPFVVQFPRETWEEPVSSANLPERARPAGLASAGHFTRWLLDTFGVARWREFHATRGRPQDFARVYGSTLEQAQERYFAEAPMVYPPTYYWDLPQLGAGDEGWDEEFEFDCNSRDTQGLDQGMLVGRVLEIAAGGDYQVWSGATLSLTRRMAAPMTAAAVAADEAEGWDVPLLSELSPLGGVAIVFPGVWTTLRLAPGTYEVRVSRSYGEDGFSGTPAFEPARVVLRPRALPDVVTPTGGGEGSL